MNNYSKSIVIIDDEPKWADTFKDILLRQGYKIVDVQYGVNKFTDLLKEYDLAVIDITMPRYDGFQIKEYLRTRSPKTKILLTSQYENFGLGILSKAKGADGWLEKKEITTNEAAFIMIVEELLQEMSHKPEKLIAENLQDKIVINNFNELSIQTVDQIELKNLLRKLKNEISKADMPNKEDASLNVEQVSLELTKKKKDRNFILNALHKIAKGAGNVTSIAKSVDKISEIVTKLIP